MIDIENMKALAAHLRSQEAVDAKPREIEMFTDEAAAAIEDLLSELGQNRIDQLEAQGAFEELDRENNGLRAARIAYASEFEPDAEGMPDTGNIHANIRKLKAELEAREADRRDGHRYRELLGLLLAGDIPMPESSVSLNVCGVPPNQDEFDEAVDFLLAQRQEGEEK
jgi:hypothetical protein